MSRVSFDTYIRTVAVLSVVGCLALQPVVLAAQEAPGKELPEIVARVNGHEIKRQDLLSQAQVMRLQAMQGGQPDPARTPNFLSLVLNAVIGEHLVYADQKAKGKVASQEEIDQEIAATVERFGSAEAFEKALAADGVDRPTLRQQIEKRLTIDKLLEQEIAPQVQVGDTAVRSFYDQNPEQMKVPELRKVRHILLKVEQGADAAAKAKVKERIDALRQQVIGGADFAALAKEHSEDAETSERGGELPLVPVTGQDSPFTRAIAALSGPGQVSEALESPLGFHIIQLVEVQPPRTRTFEEVRADLGSFLTSQEIKKEVDRRVEQLRSAAKIEILL